MLDVDEAEPIQNTPSFRGRAREYVELHDQVQTSVNLLDSLETFLSTFQKDLSSVSGQISELQDRSKDIESRLKSRRRIEKPLSSLVSDMTIAPSIATSILDTDVGEAWIPIINDFEHRLEVLNARSRVKAARDLSEVAEGLRIVAATKLRTFFLALLQPIRTNMSANMQVLQTSIFLKYKPLFSFLQRQATDVSQEVQRAYIVVSRTYYETGFRRYIRSLGLVKARTPEKFESIITGAGEKTDPLDPDRLGYAKIEGPSVILAYMADDRTHKAPVEAIFRSLFLVLLDNATADYSFVKIFFSSEPFLHLSTDESNNTLFPSGLLSPDGGRSNVGSELGSQTTRELTLTPMPGMTFRSNAVPRAERATFDGIWKQVWDPVMVYCQTFMSSILDPTPPVIPLLTMIRLMETVVAEVQMRDCPSLETFLFTLRLQMWPVFQKAMTEHVDAVKKLAEGSTGSYFSRPVPTTDGSVSSICGRYTVMFTSFVILTEQEEEAMIFSNLQRFRTELTKLIVRHTDVITDPIAKATKQSTIYEGLLQGLSKGAHLSTHPKSQKEIAYWSEKEEEARRRIISVSESRRSSRK